MCGPTEQPRKLINDATKECWYAMTIHYLDRSLSLENSASIRIASKLTEQNYTSELL